MDLRLRSLCRNSADKVTTIEDISTTDDLESDEEDYLSTKESTSSRSITSLEDDTTLHGQEEAAIVNIVSTLAGICPAPSPVLSLSNCMSICYNEVGIYLINTRPELKQV